VRKFHPSEGKGLRSPFLISETRPREWMKRIENPCEMQAEKALRRMLSKNRRWAKTNTLTNLDGLYNLYFVLFTLNIFTAPYKFSLSKTSIFFCPLEPRICQVNFAEGG